MEKSLSSIPLLCIETSISLSSTSMSHQVELINTNFTSLTPAESAPFYPFSWNSFSCLTSRGTRASYWSLLPVHSPHCCCSGHPEAQTRSSLPTSPCSYIYIYRLKCFQGVPSAQHEVRTPQSLTSQLLPLFPGLTPRALLHPPYAWPADLPLQGPRTCSSLCLERPPTPLHFSPLAQPQLDGLVPGMPGTHLWDTCLPIAILCLPLWMDCSSRGWHHLSPSVQQETEADGHITAECHTASDRGKSYPIQICMTEKLMKVLCRT